MHNDMTIREWIDKFRNHATIGHELVLDADECMALYLLMLDLGLDDE